ncbi:hypothetical protein HYPSUDRAFT_142971 [Hypholoma sublateritium FD-334 SS-4]|uniref:Myb/SANT-like domain-containing protein n=1 Tax=Hypholoma sublateritium (strain FD-334 SS-4) TaxID=945553 RepID=A0A0D2KZS8_HYPSF|nr:hypothetical protein HYPSUDRAFT_142971 [Hypholoma sublateritium FD-334 SS-4]
MLLFNQLKKSYVQVKTLRDSSGFSWDDFKQVVTASVEVWDAFLAKRKNFAKWRDTPFPVYDMMHDLVNGTVATGGGVFHPGHDYTPPMADTLPGSDSSSESDDHMIDPSLRGDQSQSSDPASVCLL